MNKYPQVMRSELAMLLDKNAKQGHLPNDDFYYALALIARPVYSQDHCASCAEYPARDLQSLEYRAIYDTHLCQGHAQVALLSRKPSR